MLMLPPNAVTLLDGPLASTRNTALDYTLALDPQRLVAPYRRESGLPLLAPSYGNWENSGLDGHTLGHVLSALAYASVTHTPRSAEARERLEWLVAQVQECQAAVGTGYVGGIPQGRALWERIGNGDVDADSFGLHGAWVPWYNLHKVFAGLVDAGWVAGVAVARDVVVGLANWWLGVAAQLRDEQFQAMLVTEFGAINGAFADLAVHTGDARYLEMAKRFTDRALFDALVAGEDPLVGLHANTQIAKALGWARVALAGGGREYLVAARRVWDVVVRDHTLSFGGNSVREHCAGDPWAPFVSEQGPESCNTHNMLRLTGALLELGESPRPLVDFVEVALMNHVVSSVHPEGGFVYFTPARPQHYRVYSQVHECFWCCVGTGMEHLMKNGELVYSTDATGLFVHLGVASVGEWANRGVRVRQPWTLDDAGITVGIDAVGQGEGEFAIHVRVPGWVDGPVTVRVNDAVISARVEHSGYVTVTRVWSAGDRLDVSLPATLRLRPAPRNAPFVSFQKGPWVLAARATSPAALAAGMPGRIANDARMGHVASGDLLPLSDTPILVGSDPMDLAAQVRGAGLDLTPFATLHDSRYTLYFPHAATASEAGVLAHRLSALDQEEGREQSRLIDHVAAGEQQPEVDHHFTGHDTRAGTTAGTAWRTATGHFGYTLTNPTGEQVAGTLELTFLEGVTPGAMTCAINNTTIDPATYVDPSNPQVVRIPTQPTSTLTVRINAATTTTPPLTTVKWHS